MAPVNSLTLKTPCLMQESWLYLLCKPSYSCFCVRIRYHGNRGRSVRPWDSATTISLKVSHISAIRSCFVEFWMSLLCAPL